METGDGYYSFDEVIEIGGRAGISELAPVNMISPHWNGLFDHA